MTGTIAPDPLSVTDLVLASGFVVASAAASFMLSLGVHRALLWAAVRMVAQLLVVGFLLRIVFGLASPWITALTVAVMIAAAAREVGARQERRLAGPVHVAIGAASVFIPTVLVTVLALTTALQPTPWYDPRHAIPLAGIVLGNVMNAASLTLGATFNAVWHQRAAIEARLALGDDRFTALRGVVKQGVKTGLMPTLNTMAAAGIITMPGIMTGQILAGMDPIAAAQYQILLMFLLAGGSMIGVTVAALLAMRRLTDDRHRLRLDRLVRR
ncbi:ABC transporter permease [Cupriavidus plantarum]|uniref:Putative ABC transport system permease protein n=1 Tax=Cupriavidus plantarum TaxID=942865 RepID=A0A316EP91_9BURK|nr:iron export ABC transporter permease subunit FetB [Cupriavidus plantarum]PWK34271.1 putative ABC transport system permease protein [Cupriavidus plantarum]